jgi:hypothetical protein
MADERTEPTSEQIRSFEDQRQALELELIKIRNEASAARLEARAAEIELMIRQLGGRSTDVGPAERTSTPGLGAISGLGTTTSGTPINPPHFSPARPATPASHFADWGEVRSTLPTVTTTVATIESDAAGLGTIARVDAAEPSVTRPHFLDVEKDDVAPDDLNQDEVSGGVPDGTDDGANGFAGTDLKGTDLKGTDLKGTNLKEPSSRTALVVSDETVPESSRVTGQVSVESDLDEEENEERRGKPAAWLVSAVAHVGILVLLAAIGLQTQRPKDQVALSASVSEANEVSMETFAIESSEPETEPTEPTPSETEYELSPVGELAATDFAPDAPPAPPLTAMTSSELSSAAAMSVKSDSDAKIQFCGVEGGGNHFVYLVDSSGSMGEGFESARAELLASIQVLKPDQRFYVVFFDAQSDYMRLRNANTDEPRSVNATPQNKAALKRWAMRISKDRGRAPYDPLRFALELKPDVIFLLSDGEFPQGIEDLLKEENKVENLFGESHPISIVHTISYHSKEGESRMRRIAEQNKGQYRYIPKP